MTAKRVDPITCRSLGVSLPVVHDDVTQLEETAGILARERFGEEVGQVVVGADERDDQLHVLDAFADEVMTALDVLHP